MAFASEHGGIEYDSGLYVGIARNLATKGKYATYTNRSIEEGRGVVRTIEGREQVQDEEGFVYYTGYITIGPGYVLPEALILSLFGSDFWQFRAWPLIAYALLTILSIYITFRLGGIFAATLFALWLWFVPTLFINTFEAYAEHIAVLYTFLGIALYDYAVRKNNRVWMLVSGVCIALAFLTKTFFLLAVLPFMLLGIVDLVQGKTREWWKLWVMFFAGFILPILLFYGVRSLDLFLRFGSDAVVSVFEDEFVHFAKGGSGASTFAKLLHGDVSSLFVQGKLAMWSQIGISHIHSGAISLLFAWLAVLGVPFLALRKKQWRMFFLLYGCMLATAIWYAFFVETPWVRYAFLAFPIAMILLSAGCVRIALIHTSIWIRGAVFLLCIACVQLNFSWLDGSFVFNKDDMQVWVERSRMRAEQSIPHVPIFPLEEQREVREFFENHVSPQERIFYVDQFSVPEISAITDTVFYDIARRDGMPRSSGKEYIIIGPYQRGSLSWFSRSCEGALFESDSYQICELASQ